MAFYIGKFYFDKRDLFILVAIGLLLAGWRLGYPLPYFQYQNLIILAALFLLAKGFLLTSYDSALFVTFLVAVMLTLFIPLLQVLYFLALAFIFLRILRVI